MAQDATPERMPLAHPFDLYGQELFLHFSTEEAAEAAVLGIEPLYDGYPRAVSCRYDDNQPNDLELKKRLDARGIKANWYFNSNEISYLHGEDFRPLARRLLENGHAIGGHGYTHPYLSFMSKSRQLFEVLGVRAEWESLIDTQIHSYAFSFVNYRNHLEGPESQRALLRNLERAGYYHLAVFREFDDHLPSDFTLSMILPPENQDFERFKAAADSAMTSAALAERFGCVSHSMHAWYDTPNLDYGFDELERRLDYLKGFPDLWHCNQNQYAAYAYQARHSRLEKVGREGHLLRYRLHRPVLRALNDPMPLTLSLSGVAPQSLLRVQCPGAAVAMSGREFPVRRLFHLHHDGAQRLPLRTAWLRNPGNRTELAAGDVSQDFPALRALLWQDGAAMRIALENASQYAVEDLVVTWRLPLGWEPGLQVDQPGGLAPGAKLALELPTAPAGQDSKYRVGRHYAFAQMDFSCQGLPGRLYLSTRFETPVPDHFPRDAFAVLGGIDAEALDADAFAASLDESGAPSGSEWTSGDGRVIPWRVNDFARPIDPADLDAEAVPAHGDWFNNTPPAYIFWTRVESPDARSVRLVCDRAAAAPVWLNGQRLEGEQARLRPGANELVIVFRQKHFVGDGSHAVMFLRLADAQGQRMDDLRYIVPDVVPAGATDPGQSWPPESGPPR